MKRPTTSAAVGKRASRSGWTVVVGSGAITLMAAVAIPANAETEEPAGAHSVTKQYAVILRQGDQGEREVHLERLLDRDQFNEKHEELKQGREELEQGYVLEDFEVVEKGGALYFSGVWHRSSTPVRQQLKLRLSRERFDEAHAEAMAGGLFPVDVETYLDGEDERWFAGLWTDEASKREHDLELDVDTDAILALAQHRTVVDIESWQSADGNRYMAVHREPVSSTVTVLKKSFHAYDALLNGLTEIGYRPLELEIEGDAGEEALYSATWEKADEAYWLFTGVNERDQDCRLVSLGIDIESSNLRPDDFECCQAIGRDGVSESDNNHCHRWIHHEKEVPRNSVQIVDFVVTRHALKHPTPGKPTHPDVPHDEGATVP